MPGRLDTVEDWDSLSDDDWEYMIWQEDFSDEEIDVVEPISPPTVGAPHRKGIDMTTLDKRHGGRHLDCRGDKKCDDRKKDGDNHMGWKKEKEGHGDAQMMGWKGKHGGRHSPHHPKRCIIGGAVMFTVMILALLGVHKASIKHRRQYERLSAAHDSAVDRNLNAEERD